MPWVGGGGPKRKYLFGVRLCFRWGPCAPTRKCALAILVGALCPKKERCVGYFGGGMCPKKKCLPAKGFSLCLEHNGYYTFRSKAAFSGLGVGHFSLSQIARIGFPPKLWFISGARVLEPLVPPSHKKHSALGTHNFLDLCRRVRHFASFKRRVKHLPTRLPWRLKALAAHLANFLGDPDIGHTRKEGLRRLTKNCCFRGGN